MKTTQIKKVETLPPALNAWVEEAVVGIKPLKAEDDCRMELQKKVRLIYETYQMETGDSILAEQWTIRDMGAAETVRQELLKEIAQDKKRSDGNLWRLPFGIGVILLIISCVFWICVIVMQVTNPTLLWESYSGAAPQKMLVSACLTLAGACWCFYFTRRLRSSGD